MRGLAALAVLLSHVRGDSFVEYGSLPSAQHTMAAAVFFVVTRVGHEAVLLFFVLSGFLVGGQVLTRLRDGRFQLYEYVIDRTTRILIPLIPACLLAAAAAIFLWGHSPPAGQLIANMVGLNQIVTEDLATNPVLWSLSYEIWFYILAGVLAYIVAKRVNVAAGILLTVCGIVFVILQTRYLVFWMLGAWVSTLRVDLRPKAILALVGMCTGLLGFGLNQLAMDSHSLTIATHIPAITPDVLLSVGVSMTLPFLTTKSVNTSLLKIGPLVAAIAGFSYTLYLTHRPTDAMLDRIFGKSEILSIQSFAHYGCRILICLIVATAFYFAFERHTAAVRQALRKRKAILQRLTLGVAEQS
jgi:peptidoglycan/LPS O-acetylase OafA/YrhL